MNRDQPLLPMTTIIDGTTIRIDRNGRGRPVVLIHGLGGPAMWDRVVDIILDRRDVIVPHLPGFGESPAPPAPLDAAGHARLLVRFLDDAGLTDVTLAGTSYGGEIAALIAAARPDRIGALVLVCPTGVGRPYPFPGRSLARKALIELFRRLLPRRRIADALSRRSFHDPSTRPAGLVDRYLSDLDRSGHLQCLIAGVRDIWGREGSLPAIVSGLRIPVRLVWGLNDRTLPVTQAPRLGAAGDHVTTLLLERCGHSAALERPVDIGRIILGDHPGTPPPTIPLPAHQARFAAVSG